MLRSITSHLLHPSCVSLLSNSGFNFDAHGPPNISSNPQLSIPNTSQFHSSQVPNAYHEPQRIPSLISGPSAHQIPSCSFTSTAACCVPSFSATSSSFSSSNCSSFGCIPQKAVSPGGIILGSNGQITGTSISQKTTCISPSGVRISEDLSRPTSVIPIVPAPTNANIFNFVLDEEEVWTDLRMGDDHRAIRVGSAAEFHDKREVVGPEGKDKDEGEEYKDKYEAVLGKESCLHQVSYRESTLIY
ncbi:unnamed protein product [Protopolystoma xenopodis]|uniref:Uncharacterized protein n=1 Tax=Protopolystoma xenopodis TaxID=117903 RepID=A0A3S5BZR1_9PLAT|nr:unnamed protein product [Protopolystoma xenopodis]